jgi:hypothetical protein
VGTNIWNGERLRAHLSKRPVKSLVSYHLTFLSYHWIDRLQSSENNLLFVVLESIKNSLVFEPSLILVNRHYKDFHFAHF